MSDSRESGLNQKVDIVLAQRAIEPDASELAEKIILASQGLPQDTAQAVFWPTWYTRFRQILAVRLFSTQTLVFTSAVACLMVAIIAGVWFTPQTGIVKPQSITQNIGIDSDILSEEFSWDSLLMMEDELAFAEL